MKRSDRSTHTETQTHMLDVNYLNALCGCVNVKEMLDKINWKLFIKHLLNSTSPKLQHRMMETGNWSQSCETEVVQH